MKKMNFFFKPLLTCFGVMVFLFEAGSLTAQTLSPTVMPAAGGYFSAANGSLSWTLGETVTPTLTAGTTILTQGFQQPEVQVRIGNITGPFCQGGNVSVPFTSSGIIGTANVFTAQLSNAAGSFASPVNIGTLAGNASSGNINATIPIATPNGAAYRIRVVSSLPAFTGPDNGANISIVNTCNITLNLTLLLQGYYAGGSSMTPVLMNEGISANATLVDSIDVILHSAVTPAVVVATTKVILQTNGTVACSFPVAAGNYYVVVKHRNTVETWSASPVSISAAPTAYNFTTAANKAYGSNMTQVDPGVWAFFTGDINQDENVDLLDLGELEFDINNFAFGYFGTDLNGDGNTDLLDAPLLEQNINDFVFSNHP